MNETNPAVTAARAFTRHLTELLRNENGAMVNFILALAEFDGRRLWVDMGYASLFDFLHRELELSRSAVYHRNAAVALVQRHPEIADALADGRLCLTSLAEIGKVITAENAAEILPRFFHLSSREPPQAAVPAPLRSREGLVGRRSVQARDRVRGGVLTRDQHLDLACLRNAISRRPPGSSGPTWRP